MRDKEGAGSEWFSLCRLADGNYQIILNWKLSKWICWVLRIFSNWLYIWKREIGFILLDNLFASLYSGLCIEITGFYCRSQSKQIIHTTEQNHQPRYNKVQRLKSWSPWSPWSYLSWGCWWSQLAFKYKLFPSQNLAIDGQKSKIYLLVENWLAGNGLWLAFQI